MAGGKWLRLIASMGLAVCAELLAFPKAHANPICFSVNGVDSSGGCTVTPLAVGGTASLPVSFDTTVSGDEFQIVGTPGSSNPNGVNFGAGTPFSIQYLGDGSGGLSQADTLTADVSRAYTSNTTSVGVTALQSVKFGGGIAADSTAQTSVSLNGTSVATFGPFSSANGNTFSQVQSYSLGISTGTLTQNNTYTTTLAAGSSVGSYVIYGSAPAPAPPVVTPTSCASIVTGVAIPTLGGLLGMNGNPASLSGQPTSISTTFTPPGGLTLAQAATDCHVDGFDWEQQILQLPSPSPYYEKNGSNLTTTLAEPPVNDPPPNGYTYLQGCGAYAANGLINTEPGYAFQTSSPFFYNPDPGTAIATSTSPGIGMYPDCTSLSNNETLTTLNFLDAPADSCLPGGNIIAVYSLCGGSRAPAGSSLIFQTQLVGYKLMIDGSYQPVDLCQTGDLDCYKDTKFFWSDTFSGTIGGIAALDSVSPVDEGSGSGGITLLSSAPTDIPEPLSLSLLMLGVALTIAMRLLKTI